MCKKVCYSFHVCVRNVISKIHNQCIRIDVKSRQLSGTWGGNLFRLLANNFLLYIIGLRNWYLPIMERDLCGCDIWPRRKEILLRLTYVYKTKQNAFSTTKIRFTWSIFSKLFHKIKLKTKTNELCTFFTRRLNFLLIDK